MIPLENKSYDQVSYPGFPYAQTHPERLATLAALFGMNPTPVDQCRVLEIGCGNGANIIPLAYGLPGSEFVGFDAAALPVEKGQEAIRALGLKNIALRQMDIMQTPLGVEKFDYIIAHGVYSWVGPEVRDRIMALCASSLTPQGIAYISYNAYPGGHLRDMTREMMLYHTRNIADPEAKVNQACAVLKFIADSQPEPDPYRNLIGKTLERVTEGISKYGMAPFFHDALEEYNAPVYFHRFVEHAARHGLQFLSEASITDMKDDIYSEEVTETLRTLGNDIIAKEQYLDFLKGRQFRQTLLCHASVTLERSLVLDRVRKLHVASPAKADSAQVKLDPLSTEEFHGLREETVTTSHPLAKAAIMHLGKIWPEAASFEELLAAARARLGSQCEDEAESRSVLADVVWATYCTGLAELHVQMPRFNARVSERPEASALARLQIQTQPAVTNLCHRIVRMEGELGRRLLLLLDGTRDLPALLEGLRPAVESGAASILEEGKLVTDPAEAMKIVAGELRQNLEKLARLALLVA